MNFEMEMTGPVWSRFSIPRYDPEPGMYASEKQRAAIEKDLLDKRRQLEKSLRREELRLSRIRTAQKFCPSSNIGETVRLAKQLTTCYGEILSVQQKLIDLGKELEGA